MNKKLLITLHLITFASMAMEAELTKNDQAEATEKKITILVDDQKMELPARLIPLMGTLKNMADTLPESIEEDILLPKLRFATWQLIAAQLGRVYLINEGNRQLREEIRADYDKLKNSDIIDLLSAIEHVDIPLLREISLEVAQTKLSTPEVLGLSPIIRNEIVKQKVLAIAGQEVPKKLAMWSPGHTGEGVYFSICVTHDNKIVSFCPHDETVRVWDMAGKQLAVCEGYEADSCATKDNVIVVGLGDGTIHILDRNGEELAVCRGHRERVSSICITRENNIVSGSWDGTVRIWDMQGRQLAVCQGHEKRVDSVCVTSDNKIVSGSADGIVRICTMQGEQLDQFEADKHYILEVYLTKDNKLIVGCHRGHISLWSMHGDLLKRWLGHDRAVVSICVKDNNKIVSGSSDNFVRIWDMDGKELARYGEGRIFGSDSYNQGSFACVSSDHKVISRLGDENIHIWDCGVLDRFSDMNTEQAQAICKILELEKGREYYWNEIGKVFTHDTSGRLRIGRCPPAARVVLLLSVLLPVTMILLNQILQN